MAPDNGSLPMGPDDQPSEPVITVRVYLLDVGPDGAPTIAPTLEVRHDVPPAVVVRILRDLAEQIEGGRNLLVMQR